MGRRLRIATYNVHSCFGTDRKLDPARIAGVIAECEADVVALQEVDVARARNGGIDQAQTIANHLRMVSHFHPALHLEEERYGDSLLNALPTRLVDAEGLPSRGEPRGALWVEVPVDAVKLQIFVTHRRLLVAERVRQTEALLGPGLHLITCRSAPIWRLSRPLSGKSGRMPGNFLGSTSFLRSP